ncbi:MAG: pantoate kinase [Thermoprotei archaeon]|jgi:pantoate kinase
MYSSPYHISGFWVPIRSDNPLTTGSLGAGILLEPFIIAHNNNNRACSVSINGTCVSIDPIKFLITENKVNNISLSIKSTIPLGAGGAVSAFTSLVVACEILKSLNITFTTNELNLEASKLAHKAEVLSMTGLGDVIAMVTGKGLVLRTRPGAPGIGEAISISIRDDPMFTLGLIKNNLTTQQMLISMWDKINNVGRQVYNEFLKNPELETFLSLSKMFSRKLGFLEEKFEANINERLKRFIARGSIAGFFVKKSLLIIAHDKNSSEEVSQAIANIVDKVLGVYKLANRGFKIELDTE